MLKAITGEEAFDARRLDIEVASAMGASFVPGKFLFEYRKNGELLFRKVRTTDKQFWLEPSGQRLQFWNLDAIRDLPSRPSEPLVICEGEFDAVAVAQSCGGYVLSVPNGGSGKRTEPGTTIEQDGQFIYLWEDEKLIPEVEQFDKVILCTDGDKNGTILRDELALRIGETRCWFVEYPKGCKDANDVLKAFGEQGVRDLVDKAKPMRPGHLVRPSDVPSRAFEVTHSTGWGFLDRNLMLTRPELMVVTGEPGHGKGQWIRALTFHLAEVHGWRTAFLTPEDPAHRLKRDMNRFSLRKTDYASPDTQRAAREWVDEHFRISSPPEDEPITLALLEREMEAAALHHNCQVFVLDPWNEIEHELQRGETETLYIERSLRRLKRKMRRLKLVLIIAAHPTKLRDGEKANLYSISGSANWRNKADHGIIIYRPEPESLNVEIDIEKSKDHETTGVPGKQWITFEASRCDYRPLAGGAPTCEKHKK